MFLFGPPNVEKMQDRRDVKGLIRALGYKKDGGVRAAAARALGEIKDPRAVEPLIAALKDEDSDVRKAAAEALVKIGAPAVEPLIVALNDKWLSLRHAAARALVRMYREASLSEDIRQKIRICHAKITSPHTDDYWEITDHIDVGIGVEFPL